MSRQLMSRADYVARLTVTNRELVEPLLEALEHVAGPRSLTEQDWTELSFALGTVTGVYCRGERVSYDQGGEG